MKKLIAMILALVLAGGIAACAAAETNMVGGWSVAEDTAMTEENKAIFDKGMEKLVGVQYEPVAYLGSQLVAGMNHCFLRINLDGFRENASVSDVFFQKNR